MTASAEISLTQRITWPDITRMLGSLENEIDPSAPHLPDLAYRRLNQRERDATILAAFLQLSRSDLVAAGNDDPSRWELGWAEVLHRVRERGVTRESLRPQYFHHNILRLERDYIFPARNDFEPQLYEVLRRVIFHKYLTACRQIIDFGCGTGTSLLILAELFPMAQLVGCDWARPSQELVALIAAQLGRAIHGVRLNMLTLEGAEKLNIDPDTAVITMHAMEQLGTNFGLLMDYLISSRPRIAVHLEPISELYDPAILLDWLALRYHDKRNYLTGFLTALRHREAEGALRIVEVRRLHFGSAFHEGYSLVVWTPTGAAPAA